MISEIIDEWYIIYYDTFLWFWILCTVSNCIVRYTFTYNAILLLIKCNCIKSYDIALWYSTCCIKWLEMTRKCIIFLSYDDTTLYHMKLYTSYVRNFINYYFASWPRVGLGELCNMLLPKFKISLGINVLKNKQSYLY